MIEPRFTTERAKACFHSKYVIAHAFGRLIERHTVAAHYMWLHLATESQTEPAFRVRGQLPGYLRGYHRAPREGNRNAGRIMERRRRLSCRGDHHPWHLSGFGEQHARDAGTLQVAREAGDVFPGIGPGHHVKFHREPPRAFVAPYTPTAWFRSLLSAAAAVHLFPRTEAAA